MKKILSLLAPVLPAALLLSACIEETQPTEYISDSRLTEVLEEHPEKFASAINAIYTDFQSKAETDLSHNYFGQKSFDYLSSLEGNDMVMTNRFAMSIFHYTFDYYQENYTPTSNRWYEYYNHITNANSILKVATADATDATTRQYRAIALGVRGYAYLYLSYLYQYSYYVGADDTPWGKGAKYDHSQDLLVPRVDENTVGDQPRSTVDEIFTFLIGDLEASYAIFEDLGLVKTADPTDIDGCVVATWLARAYMIKHDWADALKYARVVTSNFDILRSADDILYGFSSVSLPDVVFGCTITDDNTGIYRSWFSQMDSFGDGYAGIGVWRVAFKPLVDRIADDDVRLDWFVTARNDNGKIRRTGKVPAVMYQSLKFIGAGRPNVEAGNYDNWYLGDYIYLRSEEAYFMEAEILAHQGETGQAVAALEGIMKTRQPSYSCTLTDKAALLGEINYQKRVEFWGEGIEFLDNRRLNIPVDRTDETWGAANNNHLAAAKVKHGQEDKCFLYQLPLNEIENNKAIGPENQN